jgi:hypothetical protein
VSQSFFEFLKNIFLQLVLFALSLGPQCVVPHARRVLGADPHRGGHRGASAPGERMTAAAPDIGLIKLPDAASRGLGKKVAVNGQCRLILDAVLIHVMAPAHGCVHTLSYGTH